MIWTMFGICLVSVFTAAVTTIMGEIIGGNVKEISIENSVVGVIKGSIERHLVLQNGGKPVGMSSFLSLTQKILIGLLKTFEIGGKYLTISFDGI